MRKVEHVSCPRDRRPEGAGVSPVVPLYLFGMMRQGFTFRLREDGGLQVRGRRQVSAEQRLVLRVAFHEIKQLLQQERPQ